MLSKSSKWKLGFVHFIAKFTISRFVISRFECTSYLITISLSLKFYACMTNVAVYLGKFFHVISSIHYWFDLTPCQLICYCCIINLGSILSITKVNSFCEWLLLLNLEKKNHIQNLSCWVLSNDNRNDNEDNDNNDIDDNSDKNDDTMTTTVTTKVTATMTTTTKIIYLLPNRYLYLKFKYFFQKIWFILYFLVLCESSPQRPWSLIFPHCKLRKFVFHFSWVIAERFCNSATRVFYAPMMIK